MSMSSAFPVLAPDLNPEERQRRASNPQSSVWVNASAGSGKTTVLTQRVMRLLLDGVPPEKILCLTYTRAAAAEMANRIAEKLGVWATCDDAALDKSLDDLQGHAPTPKQRIEARRLFAKILSCPGGMRIRTIHSFCQEILHRFPLEAGLPPHFAVIEEYDAKVMQEEIQRDLLQQAQSDPHSNLAQAFKNLVGAVGEFGFGGALQSILQDRPRLLASLDDPDGAAQSIAYMRDYLGISPEQTPDKIRADALADMALAKEDLLQAALWLQEGTPSFVTRGAELEKYLRMSATERLRWFHDYTGCFLSQKGEVYKSLANKELQKKYPRIVEILTIEATRLQSVLAEMERAQIAETTAAILVFGEAFLRLYQERKTARAALDYDDLIIRTEALLRRSGIAPWILFKLDGGIDHLLVDEAQDTSRAQWEIVAALADEFFAGQSARETVNRTLFVVGDEKQSIFSFQRADPEAFRSMRGFFAQRINDAGKIYDEVPMQISFRSAPAILRAVDAVFAAAQVAQGVSQDAVQHYPSLPRAHETPKAGHVEIWPLQPAPPKKDEDDLWTVPLGYEPEQDPQAELANRIADTIKSKIVDGAWQPGDVMVLLRRRGRFADLMVRALKKNHVPVTGVDRMRLIRQLPVMDILALMQFVLLPQDDLNLACVLRGPFIGLSEEALMQLAIGRHGHLWDALTARRDDKDFAPTHDYLVQLLAHADFVTPFQMMAGILSQPCVASAISGKHALAARLGPDAVDPTDELLNAAQNFSRNHAPSLQQFLQWLTESNAEIKRELDTKKDGGAGMVRIMTVHASKGLEAPVVFLPDSASVPRVQDMPNFLWVDDATPLYVTRKPDSEAARRLWDDARQKQMEEYRRLMYVALTRAARELYICGWESARAEPNADQSWYNLALNALCDKTDEPQEQSCSSPPEGDAEPRLSKCDLPSSARRGGVPQSKTMGLRMAPSPRGSETNTLNESQSHASLEGRGDLPHITQPLAVIEDPSFGLTKAKPKIVDKKVFELPAWVRLAPPPEEVFLSKRASFTPAAATPDKNFARGRLIHRLLQSLPDMPTDRRAAAAQRFLANPQHQLDEAEQQAAMKEVMDLLNMPAYAPLFAAGSRAEVPMAGVLNGKKLSGQVDRLCFVANEIWVVDYKTNRPPPLRVEDVPDAYRNQMADYRSLLQQIYPGRVIRCFLLWTYRLSLMELSSPLDMPPIRN